MESPVLKVQRRPLSWLKKLASFVALGGLRLHKFVSNDKAVWRHTTLWVSCGCYSCWSLPHWPTFGKEPWAFTGIWNMTISNFASLLKTQPATRGGILSTVASLFDPLGFLAPFLLKGKTVLQECAEMAWAGMIPYLMVCSQDGSTGRQIFLTWRRFRFLVVLCLLGLGKITKREIHNFSDASMRGYGQCSYLRLGNEQGDIHCSLFMAKSRVAPLKVTTIPR